MLHWKKFQGKNRERLETYMITSTANAKVKRLVNLKKKRKERDAEHVFLVEGIRMFKEVPKNKLQEVYVSETFYKKENKTIDTVLQGTKIPVEILSDNTFSYASDTKTPQGVLCVVKQKKYTLEEVLEAENPHIIILEHLQDPGNVGTIIRTAEGAGVTGIILSKESVDIYHPKTIRSTMGSVYRMPFYYADDLQNTIQEIKEKGIQIYAAHLDGENTYDKEDYRKPSAFLIGNEGNGLTKEIAQLADCYIKIPMEGQVESLNAAIAASILMFETGRQRRQG